MPAHPEVPEGQQRYTEYQGAKGDKFLKDGEKMQKAVDVDVPALKKEKERLESRLEEVNEILNQATKWGIA